MITSEVIYLGELRTEATHKASKSKIITDAPPRAVIMFEFAE